MGSICLAASQSIDFLVNFFATTPELKFGGMTHESLGNFFSNGKTTIVLIIYAILLVVIYKTSKIRISIPQDSAVQK
ncbi:hypothetical protein KKH82_00275 [Patescibacteria group bacterium]|nr:hypothetical protein [Patescibacteria group bacterium]